MKKTLLTVLAFFLLLGSLSSIPRHAEAFNPWLVDEIIGNNAPDFTVVDLKGNKVRLSSFKGKTVLLNFWATWCPYCRKERPHLNDLNKRYKDKDLIILSIATDRSSDVVRQFLKNKPADFIVLHDSTGEATSLYSIRGLPTSYLINSEGVVKHKFPGYVDWASDPYRELIDKMVSK